MSETETTPSPDAVWPSGKVGYVALLGRPNTGKSTLLNSVLHTHLAAVSAKPQTTRRRLLGVLSDDDSQILFLDAPGVHVAKDILDEVMVETIERVLSDADLILCIADPTRAPGQEDSLVAKRAASAGKTTILAINKTDIATPEQVEAMHQFYRGVLGSTPSFRVAAVKPETLPPLLAGIRAALPTGPFLYDPETLTDTIERDIGAELIREAVLENLRQEIPHGIAVAIESWNDNEKRCRISAVLHVEREQHKAIVIGKDGAMIKQLRIDAVKQLVELCGKRVDLRLWVKVSPDWRQHRRQIQEFNLIS
ncbi:MAG: GTPase Era [Lentisphaerae bacterium RIFOXYB12_FULL_65_16]|nr:MAG: GTPase Era [Lentisphaerae bacterium RIFOXYA12_64_32]OGV87357.1 MAG: GTPase Era [Lentisphaerae bacterium RIFOXYB12_FULL_65_16]